MRYLIGFLGIIAILILIIVLIVRGGGSGTAPGEIDLADYLTSTSQVRYTIDERVQADQTHEVTRISVNQNEATLDIMQGYEGHIVKSKTYLNNSPAYAAFLMALKRSGYTEGNHNKDVQDERGFCPLGKRYVYELFDDGKQVQRLWNTSCGDAGTFRGKSSTIQKLFELQIPDYDDLTDS